jgi:hypothetical protein
MKFQLLAAAAIAVSLAACDTVPSTPAALPVVTAPATPAPVVVAAAPAPVVATPVVAAPAPKHHMTVKQSKTAKKVTKEGKPIHKASKEYYQGGMGVFAGGGLVVQPGSTEAATVRAATPAK